MKTRLSVKPKEQTTFEKFGISIPKKKKNKTDEEIETVVTNPVKKDTWKTPFLGNQKHSENLKKLGLRYGSASVWRLGDRFYGSGDFSHNKAKNIIHNLLRLREMMIQNQTLKFCGKSYQSELYQYDKYSKKDMMKEVNNILEREGEKIFQILEKEIKSVSPQELLELGHFELNIGWES